MGMDRGPMPAAVPEEEAQIDDSAIAEALARRPQLPDRVRVGVWFREPADGAWRWQFEDRERVIAAAEEVEDVDLFPISRGFVESEDLRGLRLAAARHGAHAILVVEGRPDQQTSDNGWVATYPLLLPIFFAPAQELDTRFSIDVAMYDVRNGFLYATVEAEALEEQQRAHVWIDRDGGIREAKRRALEHLHTELAERLAHLMEREPSEPTAQSSVGASSSDEAPSSEASSEGSDSGSGSGSGSGSSSGIGGPP